MFIADFLELILGPHFDGIGEIFNGSLRPGVESRSTLSKIKAEFIEPNLAFLRFNELLLAVSRQLLQTQPLARNLVAAGEDSLGRVVCLLLQLLGECLDSEDAVLVRRHVALKRIVLLLERNDRCERIAHIAARQKLILAVRPRLVDVCLLVELGRNKLKLLQADELVADELIVPLLGSIKLLPRSINVRHKTAFRRDIRGAVVRAELRLERAQLCLERALLFGTRRLIRLAVRAECNKHLLHTSDSVADRGAVETGNRRLDPREEIRDKRLILLDQAVVFLRKVKDLANAACCDFRLLGRRKRVVVSGNLRHDGALVGLGRAHDVLGVKELGDANVLLGDVKGKAEVVECVLGSLLEAVVVEEIGAVAVDQSAESKTILEAHVEVLDVDVLVALSLLLAPQEQTLFGRELLDSDVLDLVTQNNRPDHSERKLQVSVANFLCANADEFHSLIPDKLQGLVDVLDLVQAELSCLGLGQLIARDDLQKLEKILSIAKVLRDAGHFRASLLELCVAPRGESLLLLTLPREIKKTHVGRALAARHAGMRLRRLITHF
eukprot:Opistho-2@11140